MSAIMGLPGTLDEVVRTLGSARDEQLARVVAMVDAMPARGVADALIAPLRPRLAAMRPTRPLNFSRLLFTPLDPLIVPSAQWRRGALAVPRSAIAPLAALVQRTAGPAVDAVMAELGRVQLDDLDELGRLGGVLWPAAAHALAGTLAGSPTRSNAPPDWHDATGIAVSEYRGIVAGVHAVLAEAVPLWQLRYVPARDEAPALRAILIESVAHGLHGLGCVLRVLLTRHSSAVRVLSAAMNAGITVDSAVDALLADGLPEDHRDAMIPAKLIRAAAVLDAAEAASTRAERRDVFVRMRSRADTAQQVRFARAMRDELLLPARRIGAAPSDEEVTTLEEAARHLRRLEIAGRTLGSGESYDAQLQGAAEVVSRLTNLPLIDRARVVEILAGPDQAAALLRVGGTA